MRIIKTQPKSVQPQQVIRPSGANSLVLATMPGLARHNFVSAVAPTVVGTAPTVTGLSVSDYGRDLEIHPSGGSNGIPGLRYGTDTIGTGTDWSFIWIGNPKNFGNANGILMTRGSDGFGNGWNLQIGYTNGNSTTGTELTAKVIDSSPAQFSLTLTVPSLVVDRHERVAMVKRGTTLKAFDWRSHVTGSTSAGNGGLRTSTLGIALGLDQLNAPAGHARHNTVLAFAKALSDYEVWSFLNNPWQLFPVSIRNYFVEASAVVGGRGLFLPPNLNGLGVGGSFFGDRLAA